ncbi:MAG: fold metallo-hydrolase [Anaerocolumna sp.]|jgi:glyoxylase-like metal-dependent hydrolase (beta-lactamase superfamily II)|nr:fold metallo-hydrolase [Anaerocolumna sp.]
MRIIKKGYIYQLTFMPRSFPVNAYIIEEKNSLTLIDTALPYSYKGILSAAEKIGKPIERIILTHAHDDHIGALKKLKEMLPSVKLYISQRDNRLLQGDISLDAGEANLPIRGGVPKSPIVPADILLNDGDQVESLLSISAPGHTPGLMAFLDTRDNALVVGDALQVRGGIAVAGDIKIMFPFPGWATWNKQLSITSARKLLGFQPSLLACGHGRMIENPEEFMKKAITRAQNKIDKIKS